MAGSADDARTAEIWCEAFRRLQAEGPEAFGPRQAAGLYAVASICYYRHRFSPVGDDRFDELCSYLLDDLEAVRASGADMLEESMLRAGSGYDLSKFVAPYHHVAALVVEGMKR